jgi:hypothetical protein
MGPYWDVTMQTENCWEMLRFVRPHNRGFRLVWVDAICINQSNLAERSIQVTKMTRIFSEAMQVIIYLGPDIATRLPPGQYPRRRRLQELDLGRRHNRPQGTRDSSRDAQEITTPSLQDLLKRRYFSRLWVVQELLLSARTSIRIGDVDFWTNGASSSPWLEDGRGEASAGGQQDDPEYSQRDNIFLRNTTAPWLMHICKGFLSGRIEQIVPQIMALTSSTHCSDTRDQLFGVLGLLKQDESEPALQADYSFSLQHVYIGLFARLLLRDRLWALLVHRLSSSAEDESSSSVHRPSWIPDWQSKRVMRRLWASVAISPWTAHPEDDYWPKSVEIYHTPYPPMDTRSPYERNYFSVRYILQGLDFGKADPPSTLRLESRTGAITGDMVRLMTISSQPMPVGSEKNGRMHIFKVLYRGCSILLYSRDQLDKLVQIGNDDIYLVDQFCSQDWPGYLILRRLSPGPSPSTRKERSFVACCELVLFEFARLQIPWTSSDTRFGVFERYAYKNDGPERMSITRGPFAWPLPAVVKRAKALNQLLLRRTMPTDEVHSLLFHGVNRPRRALAVYQACLVELWTRTSRPFKRSFEAAYYSCFDPSLCPIRGFGKLGLILPTHNLWQRYIQKGREGYGKLPSPIWQAYNIRNLPHNVKHDFRHEAAWAQLKKGNDWLVVFDLREVRKYIFNSKQMESMILLWQASKRTGISEEELLKRDPDDMDSRVLVPVGPWSQALVDGFGCDAVLDEISIV